MADTYTVARSATIAAPPERIFALLQDFRAWRTWSPWEDIDPDMQRTYSGRSAVGAGSVYEWAGNRRAGKGRMAMIGATAPSEVRIDLVFFKPFKSRIDSVFAIEPTASGSTVTWTLTGPLDGLLKLVSRFVSVDRLAGKDYEKGLAQLKALAEGDS